MLRLRQVKKPQDTFCKTTNTNFSRNEIRFKIFILLRKFRQFEGCTLHLVVASIHNFIISTSCIPRLLRSSPQLFEIRNFLSTDDVRALLAFAHHNKWRREAPNKPLQSFLTPSQTRSAVVCKIKSQTYFALASAGCDLTNSNLDNTCHLLRYEPGEMFPVHGDYLRPDKPKDQPSLRRKGQQTWTTLIYLNDNQQYIGGHTSFTECGLTVTPVTGKLVFWRNALDNGLPDKMSHHCGDMVITGQKFLFVNMLLKRFPGIIPRKRRRSG
eukprot:TRINITY_DN4635_c1_g1_i1.p1 TRINITY_DN4635_c1_g1~~TRINITY_DN4635_c1_g1_i1.p1  ORF type:complete len:269 (-),score=22.81 TRINITY_DN4635_c1_g1_i1:6-812(-)